MTILFLSRLFAPHIGGVETHLLEISKRLIAKNHRVVIITEHYDSSLPLHEKIGGAEVYRIKPGKENWFKKIRIWRELYKLEELLQQADIIHCHDVFFWYSPFRFLFPFKKVYTTFHGYETQVPPRKGAILMRKMSEKLSYGNICVGKFIEKWYGTKATGITYGGVNNIQKSEIRIQNKKNLSISFIGRLEDDLGVRKYTEVLDLLKKKNTAFIFEAFGDGNLRKEFEKFGKVHGFVKNINDKIKDSNVIFVSSYLSMLDALVSKKLVVAMYDNDLKEDYLKMSPFAKYVIVESDAKKIVEKLDYFQKHPKEKEAFTEKGYQWAQEQSWDKVCSLYEKLWHIK